MSLVVVAVGVLGISFFGGMLVALARIKAAPAVDASRDPHAWMRINGAKQIVHIRGSGKPGAFDGVCCSALVKTVPQDKGGNPIKGYTSTKGCEFPCEFADSSMHFWCRFHVPETAPVLERAVAEGDGFADGVCVAHGIDCPKPWSLA